MARAEWERGSLQTTGDQTARTRPPPGRLGLGRGGCQEMLLVRFVTKEREERRGHGRELSLLCPVICKAFS